MGQLLAYMESGFPLFIELAKKGHAIVSVGHSWNKAPAAVPLPSSLSAGQLGTLVAVDDNHLPYTCVDSVLATGYCFSDISGFIVPLPDKIYYPADAVEKQSHALYASLSTVMPMPAQTELIRRYFVTTLSALRRYARKNESQLGDILVGAIMRLRTSQFIWVVEYASADQWNLGHVSARAILDATASPYDPTPMWFVHDESNAIFFDRDTATPAANVVKLMRSPNTPLGRMEQNLRPVVPRK